MKLLLDTNTLSYILRNRQPVVDRLEHATRQGDSFLIAAVVHYELSRYLRLKDATRLLQVYAELVGGWQPCDLSFEDWNDAAALWAELHRAGRAISDMDLLLAVLARKHQAVLVTSNTKHFEDLGLALADWTLPQ